MLQKLNINISVHLNPSFKCPGSRFERFCDGHIRVREENLSWVSSEVVITVFCSQWFLLFFQIVSDANFRFLLRKSKKQIASCQSQFDKNCYVSKIGEKNSSVPTNVVLRIEGTKTNDWLIVFNLCLGDFNFI